MGINRIQGHESETFDPVDIFKRHYAKARAIPYPLDRARDGRRLRNIYHSIQDSDPSQPAELVYELCLREFFDLKNTWVRDLGWTAQAFENVWQQCFIKSMERQRNDEQERLDKEFYDCETEQRAQQIAKTSELLRGKFQ